MEYQIRLIPLEQEPSALLEFDTTIHGELIQGWQTDLLRFHGVAGQRLFFDAQTVQSGAKWTIYSPHDDPLISLESTSDIALTLPATGLYAVAIDSEVDFPIDYQFEVVTARTTVAPLELGEIIEGVLATRGEQLRFTFPFDGQMGDRLVIKGDDPSASVFWTLYGPDNYAYAAVPLSVGTFVNLPQTGRQLLTISSSARSPAPYTFTLRSSSPTTAPLELGAVVAGTLAQPFDEHRYYFTGTAGQQVSFGALSLDWMPPGPWQSRSHWDK